MITEIGLQASNWSSRQRMGQTQIAVRDSSAVTHVRLGPACCPTATGHLVWPTDGLHPWTWSFPLADLQQEWPPINSLVMCFAISTSFYVSLSLLTGWQFPCWHSQQFGHSQIEYIESAGIDLDPWHATRCPPNAAYCILVNRIKVHALLQTDLSSPKPGSRRTTGYKHWCTWN